MIPAQFDYVRPANLDEALRILPDREGEAKLLSGGYSLLPLIKLRLAQPGLLVDLRDVDGPRRRSSRPTTTSASAPGRRIARSTRTPIVRDRYPLLHDVDRRRSAIRRSATGARSAARSRTPTRRRTGRRCCSPRSATLVCRSRDRRADDRRARLLPRHVPDRDRADRGPDRDPHSAAGRAAAAAPTRSSSARPATSRPSASRRSSGSTTDGTIERRRDRRHRGRRDRRSRRPTPRPSLVGKRADRGRCSARRARPRRRRVEPAGDVRGPVDYKRAMVAEMTLRALRTRRRARARVRVGDAHDDHPAHLASPSTARPTRPTSSRACCSSTSCATSSG